MQDLQEYDQSISNTSSSVIGVHRHRPPKINQNTQGIQAIPNQNEQSTQTALQFNEQGTQVYIDGDIQPRYPWRPIKYPNIDQGIQADPPAPYPRKRKTFSFDAGKFISPPLPLPESPKIDKKDSILSYHITILCLNCICL